MDMVVSSQTPTKTLRVLLVEDDPVQCHVLQLLLSRENHVLTTVSNGEDALVEASLRPPDVAIFDLRLPRIDGIELTQRFKTDPTLKAIPIIITSAIRTSEVIQNARAAGCSAYLTKPINAAELVSHIRQLSANRTPSA
jgi:two-component system cell cycle response regulator DivK